MIHVFSSEFEVTKISEIDLSILIEDRCRLKLSKTKGGEYFFIGDSEEWLTTVTILKQDVDNLGIEEYTLLDDFNVTKSSLVEVVFYDLIYSLLNKGTIMTYFEVDLSTLQASATRVWDCIENEFTCTAEGTLFDAICDLSLKKC
jgi:hypothetical protein